MVDEIELTRGLYAADTQSLDESVETRIQERVMAGIVGIAAEPEPAQGRNASRDRATRRGRPGYHRPRLIFGVAMSAGLAGGAAATALVLFAGSTPTLAQAFPIFSKPSISVNLPLLGGDVELQNARPITTPFGTGYIAAAENESELCVAIPLANYRPSETHAPYTSSCDPIAHAEQSGFVLRYSLALAPGTLSSVRAGEGAAEFIAVLPTGASNPAVENVDGSTTPLSAEDGIVAAVEQSPTTITYEAEGQSVSFAVEDSTPGTSPLPGAWSPPVENTATTTTPTDGSGASRDKLR